MKSQLFSNEIVQQLHLPSANLRTVSNQVYTVIRNKIISLDIEPGTAMSEKEIADLLTVSRTPVREAFIRLNREGLVNIFPQKGTVVSQISVNRAKEERFLRESLEKSVVELFMQNPSKEAIERLGELIDIQKSMLEQGDRVGFMSYDDQFHAVFYQETGKTLCNAIVLNNSIDYYRLRFLSLKMNDGIGSLNTKQHVELYHAVVESNFDEMEKILTKHLRKLFTELEIMLQEFPNYFV